MKFRGGSSSGGGGGMSVPETIQTASYQLQASDLYTKVAMNLAANGTVTIPANLTSTQGAWLLVSAEGAGIITIVHASGTAHLQSAFSKTQIATTHGVIALYFRNTDGTTNDLWEAFGDLA